MIQVKVIQDLASEPVSLTEAKEFLGIDFDDFDTLIGMLIKASRIASERVTGKAYGVKTIQVTGNTYEDRSGEVVKVYPITPIHECNSDTEETTDNENYTYIAGYDEIPDDLKNAILMRVATGFASRQDGIIKSMNKATNASIITERQYVSQLGA